MNFVDIQTIMDLRDVSISEILYIFIFLISVKEAVRSAWWVLDELATPSYYFLCGEGRIYICCPEQNNWDYHAWVDQDITVKRQNDTMQSMYATSGGSMPFCVLAIICYSCAYLLIFIFCHDNQLDLLHFVEFMYFHHTTKKSIAAFQTKDSRTLSFRGGDNSINLSSQLWGVLAF